MKRYKVLVESMNRTEPVEAHDGEWVKWEDVEVLIGVMKRVAGECYGRYCDNDNDDFLYDTYEYITNNMPAREGE